MSNKSNTSFIYWT